MDGEREKRRTEPSFPEVGDDGDMEDSKINLDKLLDEIDRSVAPSHATPPIPERNRWEEELTPVSGLEEAAASSSRKRGRYAQPAFDFGGEEQHNNGEHADPLPDSTDNGRYGGKSMSRQMMMAGGGLVALSLLFGAIGLTVAFSASSRIDALQQSVDALQTKLATMQVSGDPRVGQLQAEQAGISSRLDELALKLESAGTPSEKKGDPTYAELRKRIDALEQKAKLPAKTVAANITAPTKTSPPAPKSLASSGDWTVILVSFPTLAQAEGERSRLQKLGVRTEVVKSMIDGKPWFRVHVPGFGSQDAAKAAIPSIQSKSGIKGAWAAHR